MVVKNFLKKDLFVSVVELLDDVTSGKLIWSIVTPSPPPPPPPHPTPRLCAVACVSPVRKDVDVFSTPALTGLSTKSLSLKNSNFSQGWKFYYIFKLTFWQVGSFVDFPMIACHRTILSAHVSDFAAVLYVSTSTSLVVVVAAAAAVVVVVILGNRLG